VVLLSTKSSNLLKWKQQWYCICGATPQHADNLKAETCF